MSPIPSSRPPLWAIIALGLIACFDVWWRAHTFAPSLREHLGWAPYPVARGETEPLDCDEAFYAYMGHRLVHGAVLYRDVSENKPPLGYAIYALGVALGGYDELAIRVLPIPFTVGTILLLGHIGFRLAGPGAGCIAAAVYSLVSTDPYLYGNGAQLELFMNFFATASLACLVEGLPTRHRHWLAASGACLALAVLVKQVAFVPGLLVAALLLARRADAPGIRLRSRFDDLGAFVAAAFAVLALAALVLLASGAGRFAYDDILRFGRAIATDTLPEPGAPSPAIRWLVGNADPRGQLPPPFGRTNYLVWWAGGSWPFWLASLIAVLGLLPRLRTSGRALILGWYLGSWLEVILPGLYWAHYYLLPLPAGSLCVAILLADLAVASGARRARAFSPRGATQLAIALLVLGLVITQVRCYILVQPQLLTERYKGGRQWIALRDLGRELARRSASWRQPRLLVWGWQSPLLFYSKIDSPSRHAFTNNLMRDHAGSSHPLIQPRIRELMDDLNRDPPQLIMTGYAPFEELRDLLRSQYFPSRMVPNAPDDRGLWVRKKDWVDFETFTMSSEVGGGRAPREEVRVRRRRVR